jgi:hypothetical protein
MSASKDAPPVNASMAASVAECLREMDSDWEDASRRASEVLCSSGEVARENIGFQRTHAGWVAVVQLSSTPVQNITDAMVAIIDDSTKVTTGPWAEVFEDPNLHMLRETKFVGPVWAECFDDEAPPLHVDPESWIGAVLPYGEDGDWQVWVEGDMRQLVVDSHRLWGPEPVRIPAKEWLLIESEYAGIVIRSDEFGCLWGGFAERAEVFFGRPASVEGRVLEYLSDLLSTEYTDCEFSVTSMECDSLDAASMLELVDYVSGSDPNFEASDAEIMCEGFSGTAEDLRSQVLGVDESGAEDSDNGPA